MWRKNIKLREGKISWAEHWNEVHDEVLVIFANFLKEKNPENALLNFLSSGNIEHAESLKECINIQSHTIDLFTISFDLTFLLIKELSTSFYCLPIGNTSNDIYVVNKYCNNRLLRHPLTFFIDHRNKKNVTLENFIKMYEFFSNVQNYNGINDIHDLNETFEIDKKPNLKNSYFEIYTDHCSNVYSFFALLIMDMNEKNYSIFLYLLEKYPDFNFDFIKIEYSHPNKFQSGVGVEEFFARYLYRNNYFADYSSVSLTSERAIYLLKLVEVLKEKSIIKVNNIYGL